MLSRRQWLVGTGLALVVAAAVFAWAALQWTANFDSDEAVFGLMARDALQGHPPTYRYGPAYLGSLESLLAAPFIWALGPSVPVLRMGSLLLYLAFLAAHALLTRRVWGTEVSLVSTLLLALPARWVLEWLYRPMGFSTILPFGTAAMLLATFTPSRRGLQLARLLAIGAIAGLALWSNPSTMLYFGVLAVVVWLGTDEWRRVYSRLTGALLARVAMPLLVLGAVALAATAVFADGCDPGWTAAARAAKVVLACLALGLAVVAAVVCRRRLVRLAEGAGLCLGFAVGAFPVWRAWIYYGVAPARAIMPSCPAGVPGRVRLLLDSLLPALTGGFAASYLPQARYWLVLWLAVAALALAAAVALLVRQRAVVAGLLSAAPLRVERRPAAALLLLLALPVGLAALGSNTMDITSTRYLLISWQSGTVMLAMFVTGLLRRRRQLGALLLALWALQVVLVSYRGTQLKWSLYRAMFAPAPVSALEGYLHDEGVSGGYAGYWLSFVLDYLWGGRIVVAPLSGADRCTDYGHYVGQLPVQAYVFWWGQIPDSGADPATLVAALREDVTGNVSYPAITAQVQRQTVLERRRVGNWDVWLLAGANSGP